MELVNGWCSKCASVVDFERPLCADHFEDCPELVCCLCGAGYTSGHSPTLRAISTTPASAVITPAA